MHLALYWRMNGTMLQGNKSYIATRLGILADRLIGIENYAAVIEEDVDSLITRITGGENLEDFKLEQVQNLLLSKALQDFNMLFRPFNGNEKAFLNFAVHWYELSNLKALIRGKFTGSSDTSIRKELIDLGRFNQLPLDILLEADDPNEMMRLLEQTPYSSIVRQAETSTMPRDRTCLRWMPPLTASFLPVWHKDCVFLTVMINNTWALCLANSWTGLISCG